MLERPIYSSTLVDGNNACLPSRFDAERRQDQTHISGLVHDANAVEAALLRGPQNGHHRQRDKPVHPRGDSNSCRGGGGGASVGGVVGATKSTKSNAYVEPEPKGDPDFISLNQASSRMDAFLLKMCFFLRTPSVLLYWPPLEQDSRTRVALTAVVCLGLSPSGG